jgi:hypothetical protein
MFYICILRKLLAIFGHVLYEQCDDLLFALLMGGLISSIVSHCSTGASLLEFCMRGLWDT